MVYSRMRRDPGPPRPKGGRGEPTGYREHHDCACAPGRLGGPREEGPERTNPEGGNPRADARIQNPSGTRQPGTNPSCNAELRVAPGPDCDAGPGHIYSRKGTGPIIG